MGQRHAGIQLLAQAQAHQGVAQVDGQLCERHFRKASARGHQLQPGQLARAGHVEKRYHHRLQGRKPQRRGLNAKGEGDRQIAQGDGQPMAKPSLVAGKHETSSPRSL